MSRNLTFLNQMGDITITWDSSEDEVIKNMIQNKIDQGYVFFVIERKFLFKKKNKISHINQLANKNSVILEDETLEELFSQNKISIQSSNDNSSSINAKCTLKTSQEYFSQKENINSNSELVGMRRAVGG
mgnify:CR=1 FL=1